MHSLHLTCAPSAVDDLSVALWELGTAGVREVELGDLVELIAAFEQPFDATNFSAHNPHWALEEEVDWQAAAQDSWPAREIGKRIFLAPVWNQDPTPAGRVRVIHNPGLASGTGEHPCTQLALESLENHVGPGAVVLDVGTGSGILAVSALLLGAPAAIAVDLDFPSLLIARENLRLNNCQSALSQGSADCIANEVAGIVVANISGTVLLSIADELLQTLRPNGVLILTGFPESELAVITQAFGLGQVTALNEWRCLTLRCP